MAAGTAAERAAWLMANGFPSAGYPEAERESMALELAAFYDASPSFAPAGYRMLFGDLTPVQRARLAGVPPRFEEATHEAAPAYADEVAGGRSLYLYGKVGRLKTQIASAVCVELLSRGCDVRFSAMHRILDEVKASFDGGADPLPAYGRVPVLVLDDLGKERPTAYALERLYVLADERSSRMLPTIVTTQYSGGRLVERLAENGDYDTAQAVVSRLRQGALVVECGGGDRRLS